MKQLILGPPGTGKTSRLLSLVEQELRKGTPPDRIAFVTFTRAAAQEAAERARQEFGLDEKALPFFRTLHSLAFRQLELSSQQVIGPKHLKKMGDALGVIFRGAQDESTGGMLGAGDGNQLLGLYLLAKARRQTLRQTWAAHPDPLDWHKLDWFARSYDKYKEDAGLLDFSDMLDRYEGEAAPIPVDVAIIDEAQDLSTQQWCMAEYALSRAQRTYVAGDDDQAIYRWAGADLNKFMAFSSDIKVLSHSYRLPGRVWELAGRISGSIHNRLSKQWDSRDEAGYVRRVMRPDHLAGTVHKGNWLFLTRHRHQLGPLDKMLRSNGVLFDRQGARSVTGKHVDAIYAWTGLQRGGRVDPGTGEQLLQAVLAPGAQLPAKEHLDLSDFRGALGNRADHDWFSAFEGIPVTRREYYRSCLRNGEKLREQPRVRISTIHGAKGWESDNVVLFTDMSQRALRGFRRDPDDEHRVFYVGVTRAIKSLHLMNPSTWISYRMPA